MTLLWRELRAHARVEFRGGVEAYVETAAGLMGAAGLVVVCGDARAPERVLGAAEGAGLVPPRRLDACPRAGRDVLFSVWVLGRGVPWAGMVHDTFTARDEGGARTKAHLALGRYFGFAPSSSERPWP